MVGIFDKTDDENSSSAEFDFLDLYLRRLVSSPWCGRVRRSLILPRLAAGFVTYDPRGPLESEALEAVDLSELIKKAACIIVVGDVGAGKTTLLQAIAVDYAARRLRTLPQTPRASSFCDEERTPIYVPLKTMLAAPIEQQVAESIIGVAGVEAERTALDIWRREPSLLLFDDFSKLAPEHKLEMLNALLNFVTAGEHDRRCIIALRTHDFVMAQAWFKELPVVTIQPLDDRDVTNAALSWLGAEQGRALLQMLSTDSEWWELGRNPLVLSAACTVFEDMPQSRSPISFLEALVVELIASQAMVSVDVGAGEEHRNVLARVALAMLRSGRACLERDECLQLIGKANEGSTSSMQSQEGNGRDEANAMLRRAIDAGILVFETESRKICFRHPLFKQLFGAIALQSLDEGRVALKELALGSRLDADRERTIVFHFLRSSDKRSIIAQLIGAGHASGETASLVAKCLAQIGGAAYRELIGIDASNVDLHFGLARAFRDLGCWDLALQALQDTIKLDPARTEAHQELAEVLTLQGDYATAEREYAAAFRLSGNEVAYRLGLADIRRGQGHLNNALNELEAASNALKVIEADLRHRRGQVLEAAGRLDDALQEYEAAAATACQPHFLVHIGALRRRQGMLAEAETVLRDAIARQWGDAAAHKELGAVLEARGENVAALEAYRTAAGLRQSADVLVALGRVYRKMGRLVQAEAELQRAITLDPKMAEAECELGSVYEQRGDYVAAEEHYRRAVQLQPDVAEFHRRVGWALKQAGRYSAAEVELAIAVRLAPTNAEYHEQLGSLLAELGRLSEALAHYEAAVAICPADPTYRYDVGVIHARLGNQRAAMKALREAIDLSEAHQDGGLTLAKAVVAADAYAELGALHEERGEWQEALMCYDRAAELMPFAKAYWLRKGLLYRKLGQLERARSTLSRAVALDPEDAEIHAELGATWEATGDIARAVDEYAKACELDGEQVRYIASLARAYVALNRLAEAKNVMAAAIERGMESAELCRLLTEVCIALGANDEALQRGHKAVELAPNDPLSHVALACGLAAVGRRAEAMRELKTAIVLDPEMPEAHYHLSRMYWEDGALAEASAHAAHALALAPERHDFAYLVGHLAAATGDVTEAIEHLRRATADPRAEPQWCIELGALLESAGKLEEALAEYRNAMQKDPSSAAYMLRTADVLRRLGRDAEAVETLVRAIAIDPASPEAFAALGCALLDLRQPAAAIDRLRKACELEPNVPDYWDSLASAYIALDRTEEAIVPLERAVVLQPNNARYHHRLGKAWERLGRRDRALASLEKAANLDQSCSAYAHDLGLLYSRMGRYSEALGRLQQALALEDCCEWWEELGDIAASAGDLHAAADHYVAALARDGASWRCWRKLGIVYLELEQFGNAVRALENARELRSGIDSLDLAARYALGRAYAGSGRLEDALAELSAVAEQAPDCAAVHVSIAFVQRICLARSGDVRQDRKWYQDAVSSLRQAINVDPNFAPAYAESGALEEMVGNTSAALDRYYKAITLDPGCPQYRCQAAQMCLKIGRVEEALALVQDGLSAFGESALLLNQLGLTLEAKGLFAEALDAFKRALALAPAKPLYRYNAGRMCLALGDLAQARQYVTEAVQMNPNERDWRQQLAALYEQSGDLQRALAEYKAALELQPNEPAALLGAGRVAARLSRLDDAVALLRSAASIAPSAAVFNELAAARLMQGDAKDALRYAQQALRRSPDDHAYRLNYALALKALGRVEEAREEIARIVSEAPDFIAAHYYLGVLYEEKGEIQKALTEYLWTVERMPGERQYAIAAARAYRLLGQYEAALAILPEPVASSADAMVLAEAARIAQAMGDYAAAHKNFSRAIAACDQPSLHCEMADLLARMGRLDDALAEMNAALKTEPRNPRWFIGLGRLLEMAGSLEEAARAYLKALGIDPSNAEAHRNLGIVLKRQGKYEEATQELRRALEINPDDVEAYRQLTAASASVLLRKSLRQDG